MKWDIAGDRCTAAGRHGNYVIRWHYAHGFVLTGSDHDDLPMMALPPHGVAFGRVDDAKHAAARLDQMPRVGELSGV